MTVAGIQPKGESFLLSLHGMSWRDEGKPHYFLFVDEEYKAQRGKVAAQGPTVVH